MTSVFEGRASEEAPLFSSMFSLAKAMSASKEQTLEKDWSALKMSDSAAAT